MQEELPFRHVNRDWQLTVSQAGTFAQGTVHAELEKLQFVLVPTLVPPVAAAPPIAAKPPCVFAPPRVAIGAPPAPSTLAPPVLIDRLPPVAEVLFPTPPIPAVVAPPNALLPPAPATPLVPLGLEPKLAPEMHATTRIGVNVVQSNE
jgi:hypothetical protein